MNLKKKRLLLTLVALLSLAFSICLSVLQFSSENLQNRIEKRPKTIFAEEKLTFDGWTTLEEGRLVAADGAATLRVTYAEPIMVFNLLLGGSLSEAEGITLRYIEAAGEAFSDAKAFAGEISLKNSDLYIAVDRTVAGLELVFPQGAQLEPGELVLNPHKLNINYLPLLLEFFFPFLLVWFLLELFTDKDKGFLKSFGNLKNYRYLLQDLVSRDIKTKYRRSVLGILWSVLNPLLMMLVLTAVFSQIFRYAIEDFPVYYLTGYILFNFVSEATNFSMVSIINASGLIKKVYIPKFIFPLEKCIYALVNFMFSLIAAVLVFIVVGVQPSWTMLLFPLPILYLFIFNFGLSLILATVNTFFRDAGYLYGVFITLWVYLTPIIYPIGILPGWMQSIVRINPLTRFVEYFRAVTIYGTVPSLGENLICLAYALIFLLAGMLIFQKKQNKFIFYI